MSFYMKRSYVDTQPGIELVNIHYTWTPVGQQPNWEAHRETRAMPRGGVLVRGMGGTTLDETGNAIQTASQTVELPDDGTRRKVIRVPSDVWDPAQNKHVENYDLHHYFEVFREGKRELSPVYTEEVRDAVKAFQADNDLNSDGNLGTFTVRAMNGEQNARSVYVHELRCTRQLIQRKKQLITPAIAPRMPYV